LYVTKEGTGGFTDFLWLEGTSQLDGSGGQWTLNESPQSSVALIQVDWTKSGASVGTVKYTYLKADTYVNNYIEYRKTSDTPFDSYYKVSLTNIRGTFVCDVEWNSTTKNGRVKCADYLGSNSLWYCWDANKINIPCP
jgi:ribonuclease I